MKDNKTLKKLSGSIVLVIILSISLCITTFALYYSMVIVEDNIFQTGIVKINLNNGNPVIDESEFLFEPGMTVVKDFFLENESSCDVYYRLYFDNLEGDLARALDVEIKEKDEVIISGKANEIIKGNIGSSTNILKLNERKDFVITFHFPEGSGNDLQNTYLSFDLKADAVQVKNNPNGLFD